MTDLRAVEPMYRPAERPAPSKPRRRIRVKSQVERIAEELKDRPPRRWRSDTPVVDSLSWHGRAMARVLLRLLCLGVLAYGLAWAIYVLLFVEVR